MSNSDSKNCIKRQACWGVSAFDRIILSDKDNIFFIASVRIELRDESGSQKLRRHRGDKSLTRTQRERTKNVKRTYQGRNEYVLRRNEHVQRT